MHTRHLAKLLLAVSIPAGAALCVMVLQPSEKTASAGVVAATRSGLEFCRRAADLLYDITWASACARRGDDADCDLPEESAAALNALLVREEQRCLAVEAKAVP